jgi:hypothetical protein
MRRRRQTQYSALLSEFRLVSASFDLLFVLIAITSANEYTYTTSAPMASVPWVQQNIALFVLLLSLGFFILVAAVGFTLIYVWRRTHLANQSEREGDLYGVSSASGRASKSKDGVGTIIVSETLRR